MITKDEIQNKLWKGANDLRGSMDASKYKDYMLGLMFYKFLSDKTLETYRVQVELSTSVTTTELLESYKKDYAEYGEDLIDLLKQMMGYCVLPQYLYHQWLADIHSGDFELQLVMDSLNHFERSVSLDGDSDDFKGLFSTSIIDLTNTALGSDLNKRSKNVQDLIRLFADLNMVDLQDGDVLGDAYEYLIGMFASDAGKKAGEFYTPHQVSEVMARIVAKTATFNSVEPSIYDPTVGSASLLLTVRRHLSEKLQRDLHYYGQEYITETYNLTRMNLLLHGVKPNKMTIKNGNTLAEDWPDDPERPNRGKQFDIVVMNPPYSDKKWNDREERPLTVSDPRFEEFGVLPPESKGDFAYLMHGLYHLSTEGTMAIVLPHGVLFRGGAEGEIRKRLIAKNYIDAVIGLPGQLFTNTGIPVCVIILRKNRVMNDSVLLIDASNGFTKVGKQNVLQEKDIAKIVDTYLAKAEVPGYSHLATPTELQVNDYNLNIPRYVSAMTQEIPHDVNGHLHGGIPVKNIESLHVLQETVPEVMVQGLDEVRSGYYTLTESLEKFTQEVFESQTVKKRKEQLAQTATHYQQEWYEKLKNLQKTGEIAATKETMLTQLKEILQTVAHVDIYEGYQVVASLWQQTLEKDLERIVLSGFYTAGRMREPHMVQKKKGSEKISIQEGWDGVIVPIDAIIDTYYHEDLEQIQALEEELATVESTLQEMLEAAKVEDSMENEALYDTIKKNDADEPQDSFEEKGLKAALKAAEKGSEAYTILKTVSDATNRKKVLTKSIKEATTTVRQEAEDRVEHLTDEEIDTLMQQKWFGTLVADLLTLVDTPLKKELATLEMLHHRYADTVDSLEQEIAALESAFEAMLGMLREE